MLLLLGLIAVIFIGIGVMVIMEENESEGRKWKSIK